MLINVVDNGTGRAAKLAGRTVYGKTGTSQDHRDAWFIGATDDIVAGIWVGNDDNTPMNRTVGGNMPAWIWKEFVEKAGEIKRTHLPQETLPWKEEDIFDNRLLSDIEQLERNKNRCGEITVCVENDEIYGVEVMGYYFERQENEDVLAFFNNRIVPELLRNEGISLKNYY